MLEFVDIIVKHTFVNIQWFHKNEDNTRSRSSIIRVMLKVKNLVYMSICFI